MNTLVQELETTNEELQALNEELQSSNEELQASNEELETSNEELQATNEELENAYVDLRQASQKLTRQKKMMEQIAMASPDIIAVLSGDDMIFEYVNPTYQKLFPDRQLKGRSIINANKEFLRLGFMESIKDVRDSEKTFKANEVELEISLDEGKTIETRYYNFSFAPLESGDSDKPDIVVYGVDVTEPVQTRKRAEDSAKFFRTLAEHMPQMVWTLTEDGEINYINETLRTYLDFKGSEFSNIDLYECIHKDDLAMVEKAWEEAKRSHSEYTLQYRFYDSKKNYHWHLVRFAPLKNSIGDLEVWVCTATDIHEQKNIEEKKDEFMGIASHELKTPLTTAKAYMELLKESFDDNTHLDLETAKTYTNKAFKGMQKISALVNDLLDVTKVQTGNLTFKKENLDFDSLVGTLMEEACSLIDSHEIVFKGGKTHAIVHVGKEKLIQVMNNLITNAVKYSSAGEKIVVETAEEEESVSFAVTDFGDGIPPQYQSKIFERFYRVQEKSDFASGLGIGLYISKQIVEAHNGTINVESKEGEGSTFIIKIPKV